MRAVLTALALLAAAPAFADYYTIRVLNRSGRPYKANDLEFTPDGSKLALASGKGVMVLRVDGCEVLHESDTAAFDIGFTRASDQMILVANRGTRMMNLRTGSIVDTRWRLVPGRIGIALEESRGKVLVKAVTEGGPLAEAGVKVGDEVTAVQEFGERNNVLGRGVDRTVSLLEGPAGTPVTLYVIPRGKRREKRVDLIRRRGEVQGESVRFLPERPRRKDAPLVCFMVERYYVCLDIGSGEVNAVLSTENAQRGCWGVSQDSRWFVSLGRRREKGDTQFLLEAYAIDTRQKVFEIPFDDSFRSVQFSDDSRTALIGSHDSIYVLDLEQEQFSRQLNLGWKPTVRTDIVTGEQSEGPTGWWFTEAKGRSRDSLLTSFDVKGDLLAVGAPNGRVSLWSTETGELVREVMPPVDEGEKWTPVEKTRLSPDGRWLAYYCDGVLTLETVEEDAE